MPDAPSIASWAHKRAGRRLRRDRVVSPAATGRPSGREEALERWHVFLDPEAGVVPAAMIGFVLVDHHTHLFSDRASQVVSRAVGRDIPSFTCLELGRALDQDDVAKAVVLSVAYMHLDAKDASQENDWVAEQCASDTRAVPFFSVNPLAPWALSEMDRCITTGIYRGLKLHFANSGVDLLDVAQQQRLVEVMSRAGRAGLTTAVHLRASRAFGIAEVEVFVREVLPAAGGHPVQVAHLGGWGGYDDTTTATLDALRPALANHLLYLDVSAVVRGLDKAPYSSLPESLKNLPQERLLFGTDWPDWTARDYLDTLVSVGIDDATEWAIAPWT